MEWKEWKFPRTFRWDEVGPPGLLDKFYVATRWRQGMACGCVSCQMADGNVLGPFDTEALAEEALDGLRAEDASRARVTSIQEMLEEKRYNWPMGACSLLTEIEDYSGTCGRCGWSMEDHEYLAEAVEFEDGEGNRFWALARG